MKWFKHYTNAHKGRVIHALIPIFGKHEAVGIYFLFVEYFSDKWDGSSSPEFKVLASELRSFLGLRQQKLSSFLVCMQNESCLSFVETGKFLEIKIPKLLEVRHKDALPSDKRPAAGGPVTPPRIDNNKKNSNSSSGGPALVVTGTEVFEAQFRQPEIEKIHVMISRIHDREINLFEKRQASKILAHFGDPNSFATWSEKVINNGKCPEVTSDRQGFERYFGAALSRVMKGEV